MCYKFIISLHNKQVEFILYIQYCFSADLHPNLPYIFLPKTVSFFGTQKTSRLRQIYIIASGAFISVIEWPRIPAPDS